MSTMILKKLVLPVLKISLAKKPKPNQPTKHREPKHILNNCTPKGKCSVLFDGCSPMVRVVIFYQLLRR